MTKRRTTRSDDYYDGYDDNPIGLTGAFETIKDPQSVEYDKGDEAIGLTQAFARVGSEEEREWDEDTKWKNFDWDADWDGTQSEQAADEKDAAAAPDASPEQPADAADGTASETGSPELSQPIFEEPREINVAKDLAHASLATAHNAGTKRGRHASHAQALSPRMQKSHRVRKVLIVIVALLVLLAGALGYFAFRTISEGQDQAAQQAQKQIEEAKGTTATETSTDDAVETAAQLANVPKLTSLFGKTSKQAIKTLKRGALVSSNQKVNEKGSAIKRNVTIALANEPADSKTGTPSVYLGLDKQGKIIQVGYSASAAALGFGSLSFADAIESEHVIEKTLDKIGVTVKEGTAKLPKNRNKYATYASDKTTVVKERCSFDGDVDIDGKACTWSAVLSYDYTTQVITGNLSDTVRIIYVYVTQK